MQPAVPLLKGRGARWWGVGGVCPHGVRGSVGHITLGAVGCVSNRRNGLEIEVIEICVISSRRQIRASAYIGKVGEANRGVGLLRKRMPV